MATAEETAPAEARIVITINPEGRVSVATKGELPASARQGVPLAIGMEIINLGYMTGQLEAVLTGNAPAGASVGIEHASLKGTQKEQRTLMITLAHVGTSDLTIAFRLRNESPDLGGRDRIHFLLRGV